MSARQRFALLLPLALVLVPFLLGPAVVGFVASFTNYAPGQKQVQFVGLHNYRAVLNQPEFRAAVVNVAVYVAAAVLGELVIGFGIAYLLRRPFRGRGLMRVLLLAPWLVSPIANGVMWSFLFNSQTGLINFWPALLRIPAPPSPLGVLSLALPTTIATEVWRNAPLVSFLLLPGLLAIPADQWEQARLDGAPLFSRLRHIALPWLWPLILTISMLQVGSTLGTFDTVLILTGGGPGSATLTPGLFSYQQAFQVNNWPVGATSAWLIVAAVLLIGALYLRLAREEAA